ncbi:MAG: T9SS type A sorting domain-containing protein [Chitinophagaceae bacterium]|nr:T9SS type A sorting domain-containing protein [Chitinophagaceae bacterium]
MQTILDENIAAGKHEVNLNRQSVAAGIYFLKLLTADEKATMKIVIE